MLRHLLTLFLTLQLALAPMARAGVTSTVTGADFGDAFRGSFISSVVALGLADVQTGIGDVFNDANGNPINGGEGSLGHVLLHGLAGCVAAEAQGADCAAGAAGAIVGAGSTGDVRIAAAIAGYFFSGGDAANVSIASGIGQGVVENNRQLHTLEASWIRLNAARLAAQMGISEEAARDLLAAEMLRRVSDDFEGRVQENPTVSAFIDANAPSGLIVNGQHLFDLLDRDSDEYQNSTINMANFLDGLDYPSTLDLYDFSVSGQEGIAALTAMSGVAADFTNYSGSYSREDARNFLETGLALLAYYGELGGPNSALMHSDPQAWASYANQMQALGFHLQRAYADGDFQYDGAMGAELQNRIPGTDGFDVFAYFETQRLVTAGALLSGLSTYGSGLLLGRSHIVGRFFGSGDVRIVDATGAPLQVATPAVLARNPRLLSLNQLIDNHGYVYTRNSNGTYTSRVATASELQQSGVRLDYANISTASGSQSALPRNSAEQMAFDAVWASPQNGTKMSLTNDARFVTGGFEKMKMSVPGPNGKSIQVHYQYNPSTGNLVDIKVATPLTYSQ